VHGVPAEAMLGTEPEQGAESGWCEFKHLIFESG